MRLPSAPILVCALGWAAVGASVGRAQAPSGASGEPAAPATGANAPAAGDSTPPSGQSEGPGDLDSTVGYIDSAIPRSQFRVGYEDGQDSNRPTRAEFFYAKGPQPFGPGPPPEP